MAGSFEGFIGIHCSRAASRSGRRILGVEGPG
jgi:hypothetical protein